MKRGFQIAAIVCGTLLLVLLVVPFFIPQHVYLDWAVRTIESRYPVKLTVGDADLQILPSPRITLNQLHVLMKNEEAVTAELLRADSITLVTDWSPRHWRSLSLNNLDSLTARNATILYPPFAEKPKIVQLDALMIDDLQYTPTELSAVLAVTGQYDALRLDGNLDLALAHQQEEGTTTGKLTIRTKQLSLNYATHVKISKQPLTLELPFSHQDGRTKVTAGHLRVGPQQIALNMAVKPKLITIRFKADPVQLDYLRTVLPALKYVPPLKAAAVDGSLTIDTKSGTRLSVDGVVTAEELNLEAYTFQDVSGEIQYQSRRLKIRNAKATILKGTIHANGELNFATQKTGYDVDVSIQKLPIENLGDIENLMTGKANLNVRAQGEGFTLADVEQHLVGEGDFVIREIKLKKLKFFKPIMAARAWNPLRLVNKTVFERTKKLDDEAKEATGQFQIGEGGIDFSIIKITFPEAHAEMSGRLSFAGPLDFAGAVHMSAGLVGSLLSKPTQNNGDSAKGGLLVIPLKVTGTVREPKVSVDNNILSSQLTGILRLPFNIVSYPFRFLFGSSQKKPQEVEESDSAEPTLEEPTDATVPTQEKRSKPRPGPRSRRMRN